MNFNSEELDNVCMTESLEARYLTDDGLHCTGVFLLDGDLWGGEGGRGGRGEGGEGRVKTGFVEC